MWLARLQVECYEWGMQPRDFWECTLLDIGYFIAGNTNKLLADQKAEKVKMYSFTKMMAIMNATNLQNALSSKKGRAKQYPKYEFFFKDDDEEIKQNKDGHNDVYENITNDNKYEFLHKQKLAYEKMGYKF